MVCLLLLHVHLWSVYYVVWVAPDMGVHILPDFPDMLRKMEVCVLYFDLVTVRLRLSCLCPENGSCHAKYSI